MVGQAMTSVPSSKSDALVKRHSWLYRLVASRTTRPQAKLTVVGQPVTSVYRPQHNEIIIGLGGWDLADVPDAAVSDEAPSAPTTRGWPIWERDLHHEFVHEYEDKVIAGNSSPEGAALAADPTLRRRFEEAGHGPTFHTAAFEIATSLGFDARDFIEAI